MSDNQKLSSDAKWLIIKFLGVFIIGAWAIVFGISYQVYSSLNKAAISEVKFQVKNEVQEELKRFEALEKRTQYLADESLKAQLSASISSENAKNALKSFDELRAQLPDARATVELIKNISTNRNDIINELLKKESFIKDVSSTISPMPVGIIVPSTLNLKAFRESARDKGPNFNWVLANGDPIDESKTYFKLTGENKLPDLRGVFLRGMNAGRTDVYKDPDGDNRVVGKEQMDSFKAHDHNPLYTRSGNDGSKGKSPTVLRGWYGDEGRGPIIGSMGGDENRPKNVAVYFYIKIN